MIRPHPSRRPRRRLLAALLVALCAAEPALARAPREFDASVGVGAAGAAGPATPTDLARLAAAPAAELADMSLEQLGSIVVTSASRREERLIAAAASIFVITADDIRRIGATTLPQALRLAPNLDVAQVDAARWAISARGFNDVLANKLLVLIDGRAVYSPLFSGVFWEAQDVLLEDVERIEVISGPGATLWGANAVNGVINVITRSARDTIGSHAGLVAGERERGLAARWGGALGERGAMRVHVKAQDFDATSAAGGRALPDAARRWQAGFRADWGGGDDEFMLQAQAQRFDGGVAPDVQRELAGASLLGRWTRRLAAGGSLRLQAYYDRTELRQPGNIDETLDAWDMEFQHTLARRGAHQLIWGGGLRHASSRTAAAAASAARFVPADRDLRWAHLYAQDQIALSDDVSLALGAKVASNAYTGAEFLPSVRLAWRPSAGRLVWAALSRAVRAPSRFDREYVVESIAPPFLGGPDFRSEVSNVVELGVRAQPSPRLTLSATLFHHDLRRQRSLERVPGAQVFANRIEGGTTGLETWATFQPHPRWRLSGGLVVLDTRLRAQPGSSDTALVGSLANDPDYWATLRSSFDLAPRTPFDVFVRHVGARPSPRVPAYTTIDARLGWELGRQWAVALVARNLLDRRHSEWGPAAGGAELPRSAFVQLQWRQ